MGRPLLRGLSGPSGDYVAAMGGVGEVSAVGTMEDLCERMSAARGRAFGICTGPEEHLFLLETAEDEDELDVEVLHDAVFSSVFGEELSGLTVEYTHSEEDMARKLAEGGSGMGFLLEAITPGQLMGFCGTDRIMPPKSTYFHPKPLSGLVMMVGDA